MYIANIFIVQQIFIYTIDNIISKWYNISDYNVEGVFLLKIAVLSGGLSTERDVSITSGSLVSKALRERGHQVVLLDVYMGYEEENCDPEELFRQGYDFTKNAVISEDVPNLKQIKAMRKDKSDRFLGQNIEEICRCADIAFLALHGDVGENGKLQATFDLLGIRYTGTGCLGSAISMHKGISKSVLAYNGVPVPKGQVFNKKTPVETWNFFPCVVKPCSGGSSVGVSIANDRDEFLSAMKEAFRYEEEVIVEQYINGREFSVGLLDGKALPIIEIRPKTGFYDYKNKYQSGLTDEICPAELDSQSTIRMKQYAEQAYKALMLQAYSRIDFLMDEKGDMYCLEANTLPGMTPMSLLPQEALVQGIEYGELCENIIALSLDKYHKR